MKKNNKGFTLAEMLIVVAIIGVLIAILVPTFTAQLQKARHAKDEANVRSAISEVASTAMMNNSSASKSVDIETSFDGSENIAGYSLTASAGTLTFTSSADGVVECKGATAFSGPTGASAESGTSAKSGK